MTLPASALRRLISIALSWALIGLVLPAPALAADRDGDGLRDGWEIRYGVTSPDDPDSDGDGVIDSAEDEDRDKLGNLGEQRFGTNPAKRDTDGDGRADGREDHDGDGRSNAKEQDQRPLPKGLKPSLDEAKHDISSHHARCSTIPGLSLARRCVYGATSSDTTVFLVGDSHARVLLPAALAAAEQDGYKLVTFVKGSCPPWLGTMSKRQYLRDGGKSCRRWRRDIMAWIADHPPEAIVFAHSDKYALVTSSGRPIRGTKRPRVWYNGAARTIAALPASSGVMLLGDVPRNASNPVRCLRKHPGNMSRCVTPATPMRKRRFEAALREAALASGASHRTFYGKICTYDPCPLVHGDVLLYRDRGHLTATFARRLAAPMRDVLRQALESRR